MMTNRERFHKNSIKLKSAEIKRQRSKVKYYKYQENKLKIKIAGLNETIIGLQTRILETDLEHETIYETNELKDIEKNNLLKENEWLRTLFEDNKLVNTFDQIARKYTSDVQTCVYNLLDNNVSASKVGTVINACLKLVGREAERTPAKTTVLDMNLQRLALAQIQVSEFSDKKLCLMTDETSKMGTKYMGYEARDSDGKFWVLGLREICTKSSQDTLNVLKEILDDIDHVSDTVGTEKSKQILKHIVATMSDRAATETKFNKLLDEYRNSVLPLIINVYEEIDGNGIRTVSALSNFFCGLHSLVHIAETSNKALLNAEKGIFGDNVPTLDHGSFKYASESGTTRLIRTASKAFSAGGDEKSGCYSGFSVYIKPFLKQNKLHSLPLKPFRGSRFNILFSNAASLYLLQTHMKEYLEVQGASKNRLLKAVENDLNTPEFIAGVKCLGLISKLLTCPLWAIIEDKDTDIIDMNVKYLDFITVIDDAAKNAPGFLCGDICFGNVVKGCEYECLIRESDVDGICLVMLEVNLSAIAVICKKLFADHLPGGSHCNINPQDADIRSQMKCVPKSNVFAESVFGQLDQVLRQRPSITTVSSEAYIMFANNKTMNWLQSKDDKEQQKLTSKARKDGRHLLQQFKQRKEEIMQRRQHDLEDHMRKQAEAKINKEKRLEQITNEMIEYSLWQSEEDVENQIKSLQLERTKRKALQAQLRFRQHVLMQDPIYKTVFNFTKATDGKRKNLSIDELVFNVKKLVHNAKVKDTRQGEGPKHILVGKRVPGYYRTWFNLVYDEEDTIVYTYQLGVDLEAGDLEILV